MRQTAERVFPFLFPMNLERSISDQAYLVCVPAVFVAFGGRRCWLLAGISGVRGVMDVTERDPAFGGDPGAVVVLGTEGRGAVLEPTELAPDRPEGSVHFCRPALQFVPAYGVPTNTQCCCFAEKDLFHCPDLRLLTQDADDHAWPVLLHLDRRDVGVERTCGEELCRRVADNFKIGRAHVRTPVTSASRMPSSA